MLWVAYQHYSNTGMWLAVLLIAGILSDVFDGVIARKLNMSTEKLRKWDSNVDVVFLVSSILSAGLFAPDVVGEKTLYIWSIVGCELLMYVVCLVRFQKLPSNHAYSAKLFAVSICICLTLLFVTGSWSGIFEVMYALGILSYIDNLLILLLLREYKVDTKGFWKAR
jgi:CDP-diacylglycerol--glycerol-3-phosphate 3-phosphatidyltransferase